MRKLKKVLLLIALIFVCMPVTSTYALPGGLLDGKPLTVSDGKTTTTTNLVTDSDLSTTFGVGGGSVNKIIFVAPTEMTITGYEFHKGTGSGKPNMTFYDSSGKELYKRVTTGNQNQLQFNSRVNITPIADVKRIVISNDAEGWGYPIKEFDVYGTMHLERPTDIVVTSGIRKLDISFRAANGAIGYNLYLNGMKLDTFTETSYTIENLLPDIPQKIQLSAIHPGDLESEWTEPIIKVAYSEPEPPVLKADPKWNKLLLTWTAPEDTKEFDLYIDGKKMNTTSPLTVRSYTHNATEETEYTAYVQGKDKYGRVLKSNVITVTTPKKPDDIDPPDKPTGLRAVMSKDYLSIVVSWNANKEDDLAGYNLYVSDNGGQERKLNNSGLLKVTSYTLSKVTEEHEYKFRLEALDETGNVSDPAETSIVVPSRDTEVEQEITNDYLLVTWTETEGATGYKIYLNNRYIATVGPEVREFKITKAMGYNPGALINKGEARAIFPDGSEGGSRPPGGGGPGGGSGGGSWNPDDTLNFLDTGGMIQVAVKFLSIYKEWIILVLAVIFSPVLYGLIVKLINYARKKNWVRG